MNLRVENNGLICRPLWTLTLRTGNPGILLTEGFINSLHTDMVLLCFASILNITVAFNHLGLVTQTHLAGREEYS